MSVDTEKEVEVVIRTEYALFVGVWSCFSSQFLVSFHFRPVACSLCCRTRSITNFTTGKCSMAKFSQGLLRNSFSTAWVVCAPVSCCFNFTAVALLHTPSLTVCLSQLVSPCPYCRLHSPLVKTQQAVSSFTPPNIL